MTSPQRKTVTRSSLAAVMQLLGTGEDGPRALRVRCLAAVPGYAQGSSAGAGPSARCAGPEFRQFDFWLGDWDTYEVADTSKVVARNRVTRILGGCVLREAYEQNDGLVGESYSLWDEARGVWHQSWVTNRGTLLLLDGGLDGGRMVLTGSEKASNGT